MSVQPIAGAACNECWSAYFGEHAIWCSKTTQATCPTCGNIYYTDRGAARCTHDHSQFTDAQKHAA